jgi:putative PIN family toxin of toxin-antitoxin system
MVRAVIDTNVIVSALRSSRGPAFRLLSKVGTGKFEIGLSVPLALEYEEVARRATKVRWEALDTILAFLCAEANKQKIFFLWRPQLPDPADDMVLELAVACRASHVVTFNLKHFREARAFGVEAVHPAKFLKQIGE